MYTRLFSFAFFICLSASLFAQNEEQTLFRSARLTGGFAAPIYTYGKTDGHSVHGVGGGAGLVFNQFFVGAFGMGEFFTGPKVLGDQLGLGYGGLWIGYTTPSYKLVHLYTSLKIAGGAAGAGNFDDDDWDFDEDDWNDAVFVAVPEAGVELNVARWFRISGSVAYRYVGDFEGWGSLGKNDLNAPVFALTMRFGWFGARR